MRNVWRLIALALVILAGGQLVFRSSSRIAPSSIIRSTKPEETAIGTAIGPEIGNIAPNFQLTDIEGKKVLTKAMLLGKPAILWFTTSWCVPCQIGAEEVRKLDTDLGGNAFNVVMIFIDPQEELVDLYGWMVNLGNEDWYGTRGNDQIIQDYQIRFLDTQFLLDKEGIIRFTANRVVGYESYKALIQQLLQ